MDADGDDAEYALLPSAPKQLENFTRQLQREILGEKDPLSVLQEQGPEQQEESSASTTLGHNLLSNANLTKATGLKLNHVDEIEVKDALQATGKKDMTSVLKRSSPAKIRETLLELQHQKQDREFDVAENSLDKENSPVTIETKSATKRPRSETKTTSREIVLEHGRKSTSLGNVRDSLTDSMFAPNLLEQDLARRGTLDPVEAALVVTKLQMVSLSQNSLIHHQVDKTNELQDFKAAIPTLTPSKQVKSADITTLARNSEPMASVVTEMVMTRSSTRLLEQPMNTITPSPTKATIHIQLESKSSPLLVNRLAESRSVLTRSKLSDTRPLPSPVKDSSSTESPSPAKRKTLAASNQRKQIPLSTKELRSKTRRKLTSLANETVDKKALSPIKSRKKRRTTVGPSDDLMTMNDKPQFEDHRRQTVDNGLIAMESGVDIMSTDSQAVTDKHEKKRPSRRVYESEAHGKSKKKRTRANSIQTSETLETTKADSLLNAKNSRPNKHKRIEVNDQKSPVERPPSRIPDSSLNSPPTEEHRISTPLKGILSARKDRRTSEGAIQTTPNKSVNFGPSQGAEFNHGSPSTSMTPMPANDASRLFPLERASEGELDDAETSLNSSILDEADSLDDEEPKKFSVPKMTHVKKPGFDLLESSRSSLLASKTRDKSKRRQSLRGFSPLDARAETRRRRRETINVTRQPSRHTTSALSKIIDNSFTSSQVSSAARNNSFVRAADLHKSNRMPYAGSSTSSDAGEDMEITGEYNVPFGEIVGKQSSSCSLPRDDDTAEFSLGHLLAESSVYEHTKLAVESDVCDLPESLGDLANEAANLPFTENNYAHKPVGLDPIEEVKEEVASAQDRSSMSMVYDESDEEYAASRASLQVNLTSQFDRVSEPSKSPSYPASPKSVSAQSISMEDLLSSVALNEEETLVKNSETFFGDDAESSGNQFLRDVKLACAYDKCSEVIERHAQDVSSWSSAVTEELSSLLQVKAPALFSSMNLDDTGREAIQKLYTTEALVARTGWCQLQAQMESEITSSLSLGGDALACDVSSLKDRIAADTSKRQSELAAIREMIDREEQMALLLDAVEEQQGAHDEYAKAVKDLEDECSTLLLEESMIQSRLKILEGRAAELEPVTSAATTVLSQEVLATEEMLAIQESMSVWKICEATASNLRLSARFEDVLFSVEICVDAMMGIPSMGGASTSIVANEVLKQREGYTYSPYEGDVVLVLQRLLLDPHYISRIADESELGNGNDGRICSKLQVLENFISRSFRLLKELRELSTHFAMRYDENGSTLWVDFFRFPSVAGAESAHLSVGFSLLPVFPYTDFQTAVRVSLGQISIDDVAKEIEQVSRREPKYFTRVCQRLYNIFAS
ncbi:hypothetical protein CCR75_003338 [Bremia lactucae]|uniref:Uncharacterized protein n=1 Tax=Bremia lactucae TaxID=4779 RepID=A0A976FH95_BRELC|nr:hypothetical protein CCR75_003338 [Bremia lactucae]